MGSRGSRSDMSNGGGSSNNGPTMKTVNSQSVQEWVESHNEQASKYALDAPDTISVSGVTFNNISRETTKSVTSNRTTDYTTNYRASQQASNGEFPVVQVTVTETVRRIGGRNYRVYNFNKSRTKLW